MFEIAVAVLFVTCVKVSEQTVNKSDNFQISVLRRSHQVAYHSHIACVAATAGKRKGGVGSPVMDKYEHESIRAHCLQSGNHASATAANNNCALSMMSLMPLLNNTLCLEHVHEAIKL